MLRENAERLNTIVANRRKHGMSRVSYASLTRRLRVGVACAPAATYSRHLPFSSPQGTLMRSTPLSSLCAVGLVASAAVAQSPSTAATGASWMRYPAISPDGKTIVFAYKGDLYRVAS